MKWDETMTTTLRDMLIRPLPTYSGPELILNPDYDETKGYAPDNARYINNPDSNYRQMNTMILDLARYLATNYAETISYTSDSTVDTHGAMTVALMELNDMIYGYDQSETEQDALDKWLDTADAESFYMATFDSNVEACSLPQPELLTYFNTDSDALWA